MSSFAVTGPHIWNSLPAALQTATLSPLAFARHLKTHLCDWDWQRIWGLFRTRSTNLRIIIIIIILLPEEKEELQCTEHAEQRNVHDEKFNVEQTHCYHILAFTCNTIRYTIHTYIHIYINLDLFNAHTVFCQFTEPQCYMSYACCTYATSIMSIRLSVMLVDCDRIVQQKVEIGTWQDSSEF